jgi:hypothetical protein
MQSNATFIIFQQIHQGDGAEKQFQFKSLVRPFKPPKWTWLYFQIALPDK